jgi:hypothetical protein
LCCYPPQKQKQENAKYRVEDQTVGHGYIATTNKIANTKMLKNVGQYRLARVPKVGKNFRTPS